MKITRLAEYVGAIAGILPFLDRRLRWWHWVNNVVISIKAVLLRLSHEWHSRQFKWSNKRQYKLYVQHPRWCNKHNGILMILINIIKTTSSWFLPPRTLGITRVPVTARNHYRSGRSHTTWSLSKLWVGGSYPSSGVTSRMISPRCMTKWWQRRDYFIRLRNLQFVTWQNIIWYGTMI